LKEDETVLLSTVAAAVPHYLESWNDLSLVRNLFFTQPTIRPLFNTKQFQDVLMSLNRSTGSFYDYIKISASIISGSSWNKVLHDGVLLAVPSVVRTAILLLQML
jgi:molybdopterin-containing oxidoreductase family iron-sulfur binding subunit